MCRGGGAIRPQVAGVAFGKSTPLDPWRIRSEERRIRDQALDVLDTLGLSALCDELAGNLSTGQKKLLELG